VQEAVERKTRSENGERVEQAPLSQIAISCTAEVCQSVQRLQATILNLAMEPHRSTSGMAEEAFRRMAAEKRKEIEACGGRRPISERSHYFVASIHQDTGGDREQRGGQWSRPLLFTYPR
jgi:hypothetical protein